MNHITLLKYAVQKSEQTCEKLKQSLEPPDSDDLPPPPPPSPDLSLPPPLSPKPDTHLGPEPDAPHPPPIVNPPEPTPLLGTPNSRAPNETRQSVIFLNPTLQRPQANSYNERLYCNQCEYYLRDGESMSQHVYRKHESVV